MFFVSPGEGQFPNRLPFHELCSPAACFVFLTLPYSCPIMLSITRYCAIPTTPYYPPPVDLSSLTPFENPAVYLLYACTVGPLLALVCLLRYINAEFIIILKLEIGLQDVRKAFPLSEMLMKNNILNVLPHLRSEKRV